MQDSHKDDHANKIRKPSGGHGSKPAAEGLTCNEGQVEDLLSAGESTEDEIGEDVLPEKTS